MDFLSIGLRQGWSISTTVLLELLKKRSQSVSAHKSRALFSNLRIGPATKSSKTYHFAPILQLQVEVEVLHVWKTHLLLLLPCAAAVSGKLGWFCSQQPMQQPSAIRRTRALNSQYALSIPGLFFNRHALSCVCTYIVAGGGEALVRMREYAFCL